MLNYYKIKKSNIPYVVAEIGVDAGLRAEELDTSVLVKLSNALFAKGAVSSKK